MKTSEKTGLIKQNLKDNNPEASLSTLNNATQADLRDLQFLTCANDVQRALKNNDQALIYAELLKTEHPDKPVGFIRTAQELMALQCTAKAVAVIEEGLEQFPNHPNVLTAAHQVFSSTEDRKRSLTYAQRLCQEAPEKPVGFIRTAQDQYKMDRWDDALTTVQDGLGRHPGNLQLLTIGIDSARELNNTEASLQFAQSLIKIQPKQSIWYRRAAQDLLTLGRFQESRQIMEKLEQRTDIDPEQLDTLRRFYRLIGDREKSLQISTTLHQITPDSTESIREKISDLITLQQFEEAFTCAKENNLCSGHASEIMADALVNHTPNPRITKEIKQTISKLNIYPHFNNSHFNRVPDGTISIPGKATICIVHIGKCAGESVIETLRRSLSKEATQILEYHVFDANHLVHRAIAETSKDPSVHWILLTRDPVNRWVSSFNWDYHTFGANSFFYCHPIISSYFNKFANCSDLITGLQQGDEDAHLFSSFHHLVFGHMAMGQAWYLSEEIIQKMDPQKTSVIRTENIQQDFENCITKIMAHIPHLKPVKQIPVIHTKNNYQRRYAPETFVNVRDLNQDQISHLRNFLHSDVLIHRSLINSFVTNK